MKFIDVTGQKFGLWVVENYAGDRKWNCVCQCGRKIAVRGSDLRSGRSTGCKSCRSGRASHRQHDHPLYNTWQHMIRRCYSPYHRSFRWYGAKGVAVCERWRENFGAFLADVGERPAGHTLDRIENDRGYAPDNVRWSTPKQQIGNRRNSIKFEFNGKPWSGMELAEHLGVTYRKVYLTIPRYVDPEGR